MYIIVGLSVVLFTLFLCIFNCPHRNSAQVRYGAKGATMIVPCRRGAGLKTNREPLKKTNIFCLLLFKGQDD